MDDLTDKLAEVIAETVVQDEAAETAETEPDVPVVTVTEDDVIDSKGRDCYTKAAAVNDMILDDRKTREIEAEKLRGWGGWAAKGFTAEVAERVLMGVAEGNSLTNLARQEGLPCRATVWLWRRDCPAFDVAYREAQSMAGDSVVDDMITLEQAVLSGEVHNRAARVVLESHRWRAGKFNSQYGDNKRIEVDLESRFMKVTLDGSSRIQQDGKLQDMARLMSERAAKLLPEPGGK